jgi:hypothetical protein
MRMWWRTWPTRHAVKSAYGTNPTDCPPEFIDERFFWVLNDHPSLLPNISIIDYHDQISDPSDSLFRLVILTLVLAVVQSFKETLYVRYPIKECLVCSENSQYNYSS